MKRFFLPRMTMISLALLLTASVIVIVNTGCKSSAACGSKKDHRKRAKSNHRMAPSMSK